ncbi:MAG: sugar transferase [Acidobacteria bacterium]|nr:sugar transferase [Acidobacteriota bacterium]
MLKQRAKTVAFLLYAADLAAALLALPVAYFLRDTVLARLFPGMFPTGLVDFGKYLTLAAPILVIFSLLLFGAGAYRSRRTSNLRNEAALLLRTASFGTLLLTFVVFTARWDFISRPFLLLYFAVNLVFLTSVRVLVRLLARTVRARGFNYRTVVLVGDTPRARAMARLIRDHPWWGLRLIGVVRDRPASSEAGTTDGGLPVLGTIQDLPTVLTTLPVDEVILTAEGSDIGSLEDVFLLCEDMGIVTRLSLDFFPHVLAHARIEELDGTPLLTFSTTPGDDLALLAKRTLDIFLALLLIGVSILPMLLVALLIKLTSKGPVLFRQTRCGLNGRPFTLYKLRTMVQDAEERFAEVAHLNEHEGPVFKSAQDPRVTLLGRLLRRFSLDELPQLWNVLKGEMSLVGPRPPLPDEVARYERWQRRRLSMKPGVTGLWQVSGRNDIPTFDEWMQLDLHYIDNWSLSLDLKILLRTGPTVLTGKGAR